MRRICTAVPTRRNVRHAPAIIDHPSLIRGHDGTFGNPIPSTSYVHRRHRMTPAHVASRTEHSAEPKGAHAAISPWVRTRRARYLGRRRDPAAAPGVGWEQ